MIFYDNVFFYSTLIERIIISSVWDPFIIFSYFSIFSNNLKQGKLNHIVAVQKQNLNSRNNKDFKANLPFVNCEFLNDIQYPSSAYKEIFFAFSYICNTPFRFQNVKVKLKDVETPWMSKDLKKSSKQKQNLYMKYLRKKDMKSKETYENYKNIFEKLKKGKLIITSAKPNQCQADLASSE